MPTEENPRRGRPANPPGEHGASRALVETLRSAVEPETDAQLAGMVGIDPRRLSHLSRGRAIVRLPELISMSRAAGVRFEVHPSGAVVVARVTEQEAPDGVG